MADNDVFLNNPFSFNINLPKKTIKTVQSALRNEAENLGLNEMKNFFEENDKVLSGEVAKEIRKYQSQMYALGQVMREGQPKRTFNANV
jgi:hypothetical protein